MKYRPKTEENAGDKSTETEEHGGEKGHEAEWVGRGAAELIIFSLRQQDRVKTTSCATV